MLLIGSAFLCLFSVWCEMVCHCYNDALKRFCSSHACSLKGNKNKNKLFPTVVYLSSLCSPNQTPQHYNFLTNQVIYCAPQQKWIGCLLYFIVVTTQPTKTAWEHWRTFQRRTLKCYGSKSYNKNMNNKSVCSLWGLLQSSVMLHWQINMSFTDSKQSCNWSMRFCEVIYFL